MAAKFKPDNKKTEAIKSKFLSKTISPENVLANMIVVEGALDPIYEPTVITQMQFFKEKSGRLPDDYLLKALEMSGGNITRAAKIIGITRDVYYQRCREVEGFQERLNTIRETKLDFAEDGLWHHVQNGNLSAIEFYLRTLGKRRGYTTQTEIVGDSDKPIQININVGNDDSSEFS